MRTAEIPNLLEAGRQHSSAALALVLGDWSFPVTAAGLKRGFLEAFCAVPALPAALQWWNAQPWFAVAKPCWHITLTFEGHRGLADSRGG